MIDAPRLDCATWHAVVAGFRRLLDDDEPRLLLYRFQTEAAVRSSARQNYAYRARAVVVRQRMQQEIERQSCAMPGLRRDEVQRALGDREIGARRNDVQMATLDAHAIRGLQHLHRRVVGQQLDHHAFVVRVKMLHQDEGHADEAIGQGVEQLSAGIESACRGANRDNKEVVGFASGRLRNSTRPPAGPRKASCCQTRTTCWHFGLFSDGGRPSNFLFLC